MVRFAILANRRSSLPCQRFRPPASSAFPIMCGVAGILEKQKSLQKESRFRACPAWVSKVSAFQGFCERGRGASFSFSCRALTCELHLVGLRGGLARD